MSAAIFDTLLILHVIFALVWLGALFAALSPTLKLYKGSSLDSSSARRGIMLRGLIAGAGGISVIVGIILYYYIVQVDTAFAPSSTGIIFLASGAILGAIAFILSTIQTRSLRMAFKERVAQPSGTVSTTTSTQRAGLPPRALVIATPIILVLALLLMLAGGMM